MLRIHNKDIKNNMQTLEHIKINQVTQIARKANVSPAYVRMILAEKRENNSRKAKAIKTAAQIIDEAIAIATIAADQVLINIDGE